MGASRKPRLPGANRRLRVQTRRIEQPEAQARTRHRKHDKKEENQHRRAERKRDPAERLRPQPHTRKNLGRNGLQRRAHVLNEVEKLGRS